MKQEFCNTDPASVNVMTPVWIAAEMSFCSEEEYTPRRGLAVSLDCVFTHRATGEKLIVPAFFFGGKIFKVRFAPPKTGIWDLQTQCKTDSSLDGIIATVGASAYTGELSIYKHGFVKNTGKKYFVYDDGTPFFYLGDTHWSMLREEYDEPGDRNDDIYTDSHFRYIVDRRAEQGFTVYESEPIDAPFKLSKGFTESDLEGMKTADRYFAYIAKKGLVHANAQFFFTSELKGEVINEEYLRQLSRYWVARFGAYPVLWTLGQEVDNDFYAENAEPGSTWDFTNNPWVKVAEFIHECDPYQHPLSGHQEGATNTTVTGRGTNAAKISDGGRSVFLSEEVTEKTGHNWWAAQWKPNLAEMKPCYTESAKDYWKSKKITINYEGRYSNLWTDEFGERAQGWISFLNGMFGYGYGCADIWLYRSDYDMEKPTVRFDGRSTITPQQKQTHWGTMVNADSAFHMGYMKMFLKSIRWWKLKPDFDDGKHFRPEEGTLYTCASEGKKLTVVYLYNENTASGTVCGLDDDKSYTVRWFNTRSGCYEKADRGIKSKNGEYRLGAKPDSCDWTVLVVPES